MVDYDILIKTQPTPNPHALKFITNCPVKIEGKATFVNFEDAQNLRLASDLFLVGGVTQVHMFENVITVTFSEDVEKDKLVADVTAVLQSRLPVHDPNFKMEKEVRKKRQFTSPEVQQIEEILDRTIRPGLQADGGDIEILDYSNNVLTISYQGACGTCPSAMYGTLDAIYSILRSEFDEALEINIG